MTDLPAEVLRAEEVRAFRVTLNHETDRGCALMAQSYLDGELKRLLEKCFVADEDCAEDLLGSSRALGTFSSRVDLAYLLGHISPSLRRDLHLIRKIRNDFGHSPELIDFSHPPIAARCRELTNSWHEPNYAPRARYISAIYAALAVIHAAIYKTTQPTHTTEPPTADPEYRKRFKEEFSNHFAEAEEEVKAMGLDVRSAKGRDALEKAVMMRVLASDALETNIGRKSDRANSAPKADKPTD